MLSPTRYGTIDGEVISISRDSTQDEQLGLVFLGQIGLKKKAYWLKAITSN